jgi:hypothetical protein
MHRSEDDGNRVRNPSPAISAQPVESGKARVQIGRDVWSIRFKTDGPCLDGDGDRCMALTDHATRIIWLDKDINRAKVPALVGMAVASVCREIAKGRGPSGPELPPGFDWLRKLTIASHDEFDNRRGVHVDVGTRHVSATPDVTLREILDAIREGRDDGDDGDDDDTPPPAPDTPDAPERHDVRPGEFGRITLAGRTFILRTTPDRHFVRDGSRVDEYKFNIDTDAGEILISDRDPHPEDALAAAVRALARSIAADVELATMKSDFAAKFHAELAREGLYPVGPVRTGRYPGGAAALICPACGRLYRTDGGVGDHLRKKHAGKIGPGDVWYTRVGVEHAD